MKHKPLKEPQERYTVLDNVVMDHLMPTMSGNEFKILMLIIRSTIGWHKEEDQLSYSQIQKRTGIKSKTTIGNCLSALKEKQYIIEIKHSDQWEANTYALNTEFEIDTNSVSKNEPVSKNDTEPIPENDTGSVSKNGHTKESIKENKNKDIAPIGAPPPPPTTNANENHGLNGHSGKSHPPGSDTPPSRKKEPSEHQQLMAAYQNALGYKIRNGAADGKAAKQILDEGYTIQQVIDCYQHMKRDPFWRSSHLSLVSVYKQIGAFVQSQNGNGRTDDIEREWQSIKLAAAQPGRPDISERALRAIQLHVPGGWHTFKQQNVQFFDQLKPIFKEAYERVATNQPATT